MDVVELEVVEECEVSKVQFWSTPIISERQQPVPGNVEGVGVPERQGGRFVAQDAHDAHAGRPAAALPGGDPPFGEQLQQQACIVPRVQSREALHTRVVGRNRDQSDAD